MPSGSSTTSSTLGRFFRRRQKGDQARLQEHRRRRELAQDLAEAPRQGTRTLTIACLQY